jgi:hypothetical protein
MLMLMLMREPPPALGGMAAVSDRRDIASA